MVATGERGLCPSSGGDGKIKFIALPFQFLSQLKIRLFTVLYFSVRSSKSSALRYGLPSCMSVKTT